MLFVMMTFLLSFTTFSSSQELTLHSPSAKTGVSATVHPISVTAVGRVARMGELYDARTDQFLRISLINGTLPSLVQSTQNKHSNLKFMKLNSMTEKMEILDIQAETKLSILFGLIEVSGSGKFFRDKQRSSKSAKVSVANLMTTEFEQIDIASADARSRYDLDVLEKIDATHVVVGIQWGGNVFVTVEDSNSENRDRQTVQGSLGGKLELLVGSVDAKGEVKINEEEKRLFSQFNFELYGDVLPIEIPTTLVDAIVLIKTLPKLLSDGNHGKGKAISYSLLPLAVLRDLLSIKTKIHSLMGSIDELTISSCVKLFDDIYNIELKINDLMIDRNTFENYISKENNDKISAFSNRYKVYQNKLIQNLSQHVMLIRSGQEPIEELMDVLDDVYNHELSPNNIDFAQFLPIQREFRFFKLLSDLQVTMLDKETSFEEFMARNFDKNIYTFFYSVEFPKLSGQPMKTFRKILEKRETYDSTGIYVAIKIDVLSENEKNFYFNFANETRLRLYKNGDCIIDNYVITTNPSSTDEPEMWSINFMQTQLTQLIHNPVPIGFVYIQYPDMPEPKTIWPTVKWIQITSRYAGLFFRAEGESASCFGCPVQSDTSPRIQGFEFNNNVVGKLNINLDYNEGSVTNNWLQCGGYDGRWVGIRAVTTHKEVRPKNKSIRIWERRA